MIAASLLSRASFIYSLSAPIISNNAFLALNAPNDAPQASLPLIPVPEKGAEMCSASRLVRKATSEYLSNQPSMAGPLLRLAFHDGATREKIDDMSFTGGPNGSIRYEIDWSENRGIAKPLKVVETIYNDVGSVLSFADCIALSAVEAVKYAGGPNIQIRLGRQDATKADAKMRREVLRSETERSVVETTLPSAALDSDGLRLFFGALGLSEQELVALCGAHDLGRHVTLLDMPKTCLKNLSRECLENAPVLMPFVSEEPDRFSNIYFKKLLKWYDRKVELGEVAFIPTDVALVVDEGLRKHVKQFAKDKNAFFLSFESALLKVIDAGATSLERY